MSLIVQNSNISTGFSQVQKAAHQYKDNDNSTSSKEKINNKTNRHLLLRNAPANELHHFLSPHEKKVLKEIFEVSDNDMKKYYSSFNPITYVNLLKGSKLDITW